MTKTAHCDAVYATYQDKACELFASVETMIAIYENQFDVERVNVVNLDGHLVALITYTEIE